MNMLRVMARPVSCLAIAGMLSWSLPIAPAQAALVGSEATISHAQAAADRERVYNFLNRDEVRAEMERLGVSPAEAIERVAGLTDAEVAEITGRLDQLPAGQDTVGAIIGVAVVLFVVLLVTDILGFTSVFPFTRPMR